jgi:hypothetical protein
MTLKLEKILKLTDNNLKNYYEKYQVKTFKR